MSKVYKNIKYRTKPTFLLVMCIAVYFILFIGCADIAPTAHPSPSTELSPPQDPGTIFPSIQSVYPGTLQTLNIPQSYPNDVNTAAADNVVVFSHTMENDSDEMKRYFLLYEDFSSIPTPISISPSNSSRYFIINPLTGGFKENTIYSLYIYRFAHVDDEPFRLLEFQSLVELPASTLSPANPEYVKYIFQTGSSADPDLEPPTILNINPRNGEKNVDPGLGQGFIEIVFLDNIVPMIYPPTVNIDTVSLENMTDTAGELDLLIQMDASDDDFKTFRIYPLDNLLNGKNYKLKISIDDQITDFQGNSVSEMEIFFDTAPIP